MDGNDLSNWGQQQPKEGAGPFTTPPPGGSMPLPEDRPLRAPRAEAPQNLTDQERRELEAQGWQEGEPLPESVAQEFTRVRQELDEEADRRQIDPGSVEPGRLEVQDAQNLPPDRRREVEAEIERITREATRRPQRPAEPRQDRATQEPPPPQQERPETPPRPEQPAAAAAAPPQAESPQTEPESAGGDTRPTQCPNCHWDLSRKSPAEPTERDKAAFVQAWLGGVPFIKDFPMFEGEVTMTFRTLTPPELQAIFEQVNAETKEGKVETEFQFLQRVQHLRTCLQLQKLTTSRNGPVHDADGLSAEHRPEARNPYKLPPDCERPLDPVEWKITHEVLPTESMLRMAEKRCTDFNRLVSKLEAQANSADFSEPAGSER